MPRRWSLRAGFSACCSRIQDLAQGQDLTIEDAIAPATPPQGARFRRGRPIRAELTEKGVIPPRTSRWQDRMRREK